MSLDLSAPHWVYRFYDEGGALLYVGLTKKPARRMTDWRKRAKQDPDHWFHRVSRVGWLCYRNKVAGMSAERQAIQTELPLHNVMLHPDRKERTNWSAASRESEAAS